jgi:hypothetical protein
MIIIRKGFGNKPQKIASVIAGLFLTGAVFAQTTPNAPTAGTAPAITTQNSTTFSAGVTSALRNATTNIIYLEQSGTTPTVSITQDGNSNRAGSDSTGTVNSMVINGNSQVVTIEQTGTGNLIDSLKVYGDSANVNIQQVGVLNSINALCGDGTTHCGNAALDWRFDSTGKQVGNTLNYTGAGSNLISSIYVTGGGNTINSQQTGDGHQQLINVIGSDNNTINVLQSSASVSSLVLTQNGTGGTTFNVSQTGTYSNVANISATAAGGSFNIIQRSR